MLAIILRTKAKGEHGMNEEKKTDRRRSRRRDYWSVKWGIRNEYRRNKLLKVSLRVVVGISRYIYLAIVKCKHLGDDAAGTATSTVFNWSGGRGLNIWGVGGDGEEGSEEIHWCMIG